MLKLHLSGVCLQEIVTSIKLCLIFKEINLSVNEDIFMYYYVLLKVWAKKIDNCKKCGYIENSQYFLS